MKKLLMLLPAMLVLAACGGNGGATSTSEPSDPEAEARAIAKAKLENIAFVSRATPLIVNTPTDIGQKNDVYNNDYLFLTTKQTIADKQTEKNYTVEIEWNYDKNDGFVREAVNSDETHLSIYFNYSKTDEHDFPFTATFKCGSTTDGSPLSYQVHLLLKNLEFLELSIADIYEVNETNNGFALVNPETGYYIANNDNFDYTCVETYGEVIYVAPDGNWALIGDGDNVLELYSGNALNLKPEVYPALVVGNAVTVQAELGSYYGNCQISFIFDITQGDPAKVTKPNNFRALSGAGFDGKHYWEGGLMNTTRAISAVYDGNLKQNNSLVSNVDNLTNGRFTFDVKVDGAVMQVAYDYHVDRDGELGIFDAYKAILKGLSVGSALTVKGTVRFAGSIQKSYKGNEAYTDWSITPYFADHMAA